MSKLEHGSITAQEGQLAGTEITFMYNPTEYSITKSNTWNKKDSAASNVSLWHFGGGQPRRMTLELFFDSYKRKGVAKDAVRKATNMLFRFMMIDESLKKGPDKLGRPPKCLLQWGSDTKNQFNCYISQCAVKYLMFDGETGIPVRATASLTLEEERDPDHLQPTNPTSLGEPGRRVWMVQEGDRLDWIAYREYGDCGEWRRIAEANRLCDPLALSAGMALSIPPL